MKDQSIQDIQRIVGQVEDLNEPQLVAGLAVVSKDLARYLEANPRPDAEKFSSVYSDVYQEERKAWSDSPFFKPLRETGMPTGSSEQAVRGDFDLTDLKDPGIVHEWTVGPGHRLLERFGREFREAICGPGGPYEQFQKGLVGQAQLPATVVASILAAGLSAATLWYPLAVYIALLLIKSGLATYCKVGE